MAVQIQVRRDTAANFTSANPTLASGEVGLETDTRLWKFGDGSTAWTSLAYMNEPQWTRVRKGTDESVNSAGTGTTLQNDDELFFTAASTVSYEVEGVLIYASPAGAAVPDLKVAFGEDATSRGTFLTARHAANDSAAGGVVASNQADAAATGTAAAKRPFYYRGVHTGNGGTFRILWAQNTSDANNTTVYAGSFLRYRAVT